MRRIIVSIIFVLTIGISCISCQKTPEKSMVVDRSEGLSQECVIPKEENHVPKNLKIPKHWDETIIRKDGLVTLTADYDIQIPEIYNTPVYAYEIQLMDQKLLEKLCAYFSNGDSLYEDTEMTKSELNIERDKIVNGVGNWGYYDQNYKDSMIGRVDALIEKVAEQKEERKPVEAGLTIPQKSGMELIDKSWVNSTHKRSWHDWYYETEKQIGFTARIDRGRESNPFVRATDYDDEVGSTTAFVYRQGTFIDENELNQEWALEDTFDNGNKVYLSYLSNELEQAKDVMFTKEDAVKEADRVLEDLGIKGFAVGDCVKAIGDTDSESWAGVEENGLPKSVGYAVYLSPKAGDVTGYPLPLAATPYEELAEPIYAPSFLTEGIRIIVTKEGIQLFEWTDISKRKDIVAENTKLLTFDDIKEKLVDHLLYTRVASLGGINPEGFAYTYIIKNVQLRAANINAYENPEAAWLVPVWIFDVEGEETYTTTEVTDQRKMGPETVVLNAIDGGFVQVQVDW